MDLIGKKFGKLKIIKRSSPNNGRARWLCKCDCGKEKIVSGGNLKNGSTKSCGCLRREIARKHCNEQYLECGLANMRATIRNYKRNAKRRGLEYKLTDEQFRDITQKDCYYCGAKPNNSMNMPKSNGTYIYNGIDRVDGNKGYIIDNIVPCCKTCNQAKSDYNLEEFRDWVRRAYFELWG